MSDKRIIKNAVRCNYCGYELESTYRHDFRCHCCTTAPIDHWEMERKWVDDPSAPGGQRLIETGKLEPPTFWVDGGRAYLRRMGNHRHWTDISEYEP